MLVKCKYCHARVRQRQLPSHEKNCPKARRLKKLEYNKLNTQDLEYREKLLSELGIEFTKEHSNLSDIQFNDLVDRLTLLRKEKEEKENLLLEKQKEKEEKLEAEKLEQERKDAEIEEKKEKEELDRLAQIENEKEALNLDNEKREQLQKTFEKQRIEVPEKTEEEKIKEDIDKINKLYENPLPEKKKAVRKKK